MNAVGNSRISLNRILDPDPIDCHCCCPKIYIYAHWYSISLPIPFFLNPKRLLTQLEVIHDVHFQQGIGLNIHYLTDIKLHLHELEVKLQESIYHRNFFGSLAGILAPVVLFK